MQEHLDTAVIKELSLVCDPAAMLCPLLLYVALGKHLSKALTPCPSGLRKQQHKICLLLLSVLSFPHGYSLGQLEKSLASFPMHMCCCALVLSIQGGYFKVKYSTRIYSAINSWQDSKLFSTNASLTPQLKEVLVSVFRLSRLHAYPFFSRKKWLLYV